VVDRTVEVRHVTLRYVNGSLNWHIVFIAGFSGFVWRRTRLACSIQTSDEALKSNFQASKQARTPWTREKYATNATDADDASDATAKTHCVALERRLRCVLTAVVFFCSEFAHLKQSALPRLNLGKKELGDSGIRPVFGATRFT